MPETKNMKSYISEPEMAERLGVHYNTIRNWVKRGLIKPALITPARRRMYTIEQVEELMKKGQEAAQADVGE